MAANYSKEIGLRPAHEPHNCMLQHGPDADAFASPSSALASR